MAKDGFDLLSRIKLSFVSPIAYYPIIFVYGLFGLATVIWKRNLSDADSFHVINAIAGLALTFTAVYNTVVVPAMYFTTCSYSFAILAARVIAGLRRSDVAFLALVFLVTSGLNDVRILTCDNPANRAFLADTRDVAGYLTENTESTDHIVLDSYPLFYIPLLSNLHVVPEYTETNQYRLLYDLNETMLTRIRDDAKYVVVYHIGQEKAGYERELMENLGLEYNDRARNLLSEAEKPFIDGTCSVKTRGSIDVRTANNPPGSLCP
jgi:hypothetical protein